MLKTYNDIGLLKEIASDLYHNSRAKCRPLERHRESKDHFENKRKARKMAKASRRKNRRC